MQKVWFETCTTFRVLVNGSGEKVNLRQQKQKLKQS